MGKIVRVKVLSKRCAYMNQGLTKSISNLCSGHFKFQVPWRNKSQEFNSAKFDVSPDGKLLAWVGRFGSIHLVSATTKELLWSLKMNDWCRELRFSRDGGSLYTIGEGGEVYIWDVRSEITSSYNQIVHLVS